MAGNRRRKSSRWRVSITGTTCWPPWSEPCATALSRRIPWNASWRCRPGRRRRWKAWQMKNRALGKNCLAAIRRRCVRPRITNTYCSRSQLTMTRAKKKTTAARKTTASLAANLRERVLDDLATLKVPISAETLDTALSRAEQEGLSHLGLLELLFGEPATRSRRRAVERRIRDAKFPEDKNLE